MSRYIKFDDAVKVMACEMYAEAQSQGYDVDGIEDFMPEAKAWLNDAPSIDIEPKRGEWIPCSERLPSEDGRYLVWAVIGIMPDHVDDPSTYQGITIAGYYGDAHPIKWLGNVEKVLAWMPLPKPWKGADDE